MSETIFWDLNSHQDKHLELVPQNNSKEFSFSLWNFARRIESDPTPFSDQGNHFGFVQSGEIVLEFQGRKFPLHEGMYFSANGPIKLLPMAQTHSSGIVMFQRDFKGIFQIGGPVESSGRLRYIDGCSDTLLISPTRKGEACVNFLNLPAGTNQTFHTHPSLRFGIVSGGRGFCDTENRSIELMPGKVFYIPTNGLHRFRTETESLSVIAFHPDSDFGPDDDNHPMVNKTMVDGISAATLSYEQRGIQPSE